MSAASFKEIGNKHLQAGEFDQAIEAYTKAIELDPSDHVFFSNRSAAYLSKGDANNALADGEKCIEINPSWAKGYSRKGAALHKLRQYEEAKAAFNAGLAIAPTDAGLKSGLAEVEKVMLAPPPPAGGGLFGPQMLAKLAGHPKFAPKLADPTFRAKLQMVQSNPQLLMSDPELMEVLQVILGGAGDQEEEPFSPPSYSPPKSSAKPVSVPQPEPEPEDLTPEEAEERRRKKEALAAKERGNTLYKNKQFEEAIAAYDEAIALDPSNITFANNKAAVFIEKGEIDLAIQTCEQALEAGRAYRISYEDKAKVYQRIAAAHLKRDDIKSALEAYGKAQMENHDKAIERKVKNLELELKKKQREQYINPELGLEAKERGNTAFREGNFPQAITEYEEAVKRDPTNASYYNNLAAAFQKMGLFNDAKRSVEKSLEIDRNYVKAWAKKGDIEFFMKEYHKALESYRAGLQIDPENALCKQGMQKVVTKINSSEGVDQERTAHAMADPEIQQILRDPSINQVLTDLQDPENAKHAQRAMGDPDIRKKIEKLVAAGVLSFK